jgi:transposase
MECTYLHVGFFNDPLPESSNFKTLNFLKQYKSKLERAEREYASFKSGLEWGCYRSSPYLPTRLGQIFKTIN